MNRRLSNGSGCLVLLASEEARSALRLAKMLSRERYRVERAPTMEAAVTHGARVLPDAVVLEVDMLTPRAGVALCRALHRAPWMESTMPLVVIGRAIPSRTRAALLRAGAWDVLERPVASWEVVLRLRRYLAARQELQRADTVALVEPSTGFYNRRGLERRIEELAADAFRRQAALACLAIRPAVPAGALPESASRRVAEALRLLLRSTRRSDVVGRSDEGEFLVLAPRTSSEGAVGLAQRLLRQALTLTQQQGGSLPAFRIGYEAVANMQEGPRNPGVLLAAAIEAARQHDTDPHADPIQAFRAPSSSSTS